MQSTIRCHGKCPAVSRELQQTGTFLPQLSRQGKRTSPGGQTAVALAAAAPSAAAVSSTQSSGRVTYVTQQARDGLFNPAVEQPTEVEAQVHGSLPTWLSGSLLTNGGGDYRGKRHMFDGYACMSKVRVEGSEGRAWAQQRFVQSDAYASFRDTGRMRYREFATPLPADTALERAAGIMTNMVALATKSPKAFTDNASVNMVPLPGGRLMALSETQSSQYLVDPASLATLEQVTLRDAVAGDLTTAHPKALADGRLVNFTRSLPFGGFHAYVQDTATLERKQVAFIRDRDPLNPCWVHDISATQTHLIIIENPLYMSMPSLVAGTPTPYIFMNWRPETGTRVHVVALDGSGAVTHEAPPFFTFHLGNAYEEVQADGAVALHVDYSHYEDPEVLLDLGLDRLQAYPGADIAPSTVRRLTMPLRDASGRPAGPSKLAAPAQMVDDDAYGRFFEFPAFNPIMRGQAYRYLYGTGAARPTNMGNALARHDLAAGSTLLWHEEGATPSEPVFVARPGSSAEDDGVVVSLVAGAAGDSFLLVLDARTMTEVARCMLPFAVPYRFHGTFVATHPAAASA